MTSRLLTVADVAEALQVDKSWVYAACRSGRIPHIRLGRYVRFSESAIEAWMTEIQSNSHTSRTGRIT